VVIILLHHNLLEFTGVNCPFCGHADSRVIDSRDVDEGVRRRRQCLGCESRFTTYERLQPVSLFVIKKDRRREEFKRDKLLGGVRKACEKRPLTAGVVEKVVDDIEAELYQMGKSEISSTLIGDMVMEKLKTLDYIAYIRFASVYREFADITALKEAVDNLIGTQKEMVRHPVEQLPLIPENGAGETLKGQARRKK
jgi:transcriptional repressor NrdR